MCGDWQLHSMRHNYIYNNFMLVGTFNDIVDCVHSILTSESSVSLIVTSTQIAFDFDCPAGVSSTHRHLSLLHHDFTVFYNTGYISITNVECCAVFPNGNHYVPLIIGIQTNW